MAFIRTMTPPRLTVVVDNFSLFWQSETTAVPTADTLGPLWPTNQWLRCRYCLHQRRDYRRFAVGRTRGSLSIWAHLLRPCGRRRIVASRWTSERVCQTNDDGRWCAHSIETTLHGHDCKTYAECHEQSKPFVFRQNDSGRAEHVSPRCDDVDNKYKTPKLHGFMH